MKLGIIQDWSQEGFRYVASKGLETIEFCVNGNYDAAAFLSKAPQIRAWSVEYGVAIAAIGRWGRVRLDAQGVPIPAAVREDEMLIDAASMVGCPVFNCGCNRVEALTFEQNCQAAIDYFAHLIEYAEGRSVKIAVFNCDWDNFVVEENAWRIVLGALPKLGLKYDTSHCIGRKGDYLREIRDWGERIYHVHIKGSSYIAGEHYDDPPAGLDDVHWGPVFNLLYTKGYNGALSIEPHSENWMGERGEWGVDFTIRFIRPMLMPDDYREVAKSPYMP